MTLSAARLAVAAITLLVGALPLHRLVEVTLDIKGASAWIAVAGVFTIVGGCFALYGAIKNNAEQTEMIIGAEETFCQLTIFIDRDGPGWFLSTLHHGPGGPIYDVQVYIREVTEDGEALKEDLVTIGTMTSTTWPRQVYPLGQPRDLTKDGRPRYFRAQTTQRNGVTIQDIVVYPRPKGFVELGFLRLEFNKKPYPPSDKLMLPRISRLIQIPEGEIARIDQLRHASEARRRERLDSPDLDLTLDRDPSL